MNYFRYSCLKKLDVKEINFTNYLDKITDNVSEENQKSIIE